jgi:hypothetical protein
MRTAPLALVLATVSVNLHAAADGSATSYWVRVMPELWSAKLDGTFSYATGGATPTTLGTSQLGLDERKNTFAIEAGARLPFLFSFDAGYFGFSTEGTRPLDRTAHFGSQTFSVSTQVHTKVELIDYYGEVSVRPIDLDIAGFGIGIAAHWLDGKASLDDLSSGQDESLSHQLVIPAVALRAHVTPLHGLTIEGRLHWMDAGISGDHTHFIDAEIQASYRPIRWVGVLGGYRYALYDLHVKDPQGANSTADIDAHLGGPYLGLVAEF